MAADHGHFKWENGGVRQLELDREGRQVWVLEKTKKKNRKKERKLRK
jgi:hypothetical protein